MCSGQLSACLHLRSLSGHVGMRLPASRVRQNLELWGLDCWIPGSEEWCLKNEAFSLSHSLPQCFHSEVSRCAGSGVPGTGGQPWLSSFLGMGEAHSRRCPVATERASRAFPCPLDVYHVALQPCPTIPTLPSLGVCLCDLVCAPMTCRAGVLGALTNSPVFFLLRSPISPLSDLAVFQDRLRMLTVGGMDTLSLSFLQLRSHRNRMCDFS